VGVLLTVVGATKGFCAKLVNKVFLIIVISERFPAVPEFIGWILTMVG
jgi:hypothetical protein